MPAFCGGRLPACIVFYIPLRHCLLSAGVLACLACDDVAGCDRQQAVYAALAASSCDNLPQTGAGCVFCFTNAHESCENGVVHVGGIGDAFAIPHVKRAFAIPDVKSSVVLPHADMVNQETELLAELLIRQEELESAAKKAEDRAREAELRAAELSDRHASMMARGANVIAQVQWYFTEENMVKDDYLYDQMDPETGWVPLSTLAQFSRLKALCVGEAELGALLRCSVMLEVSGSGHAVRSRKWRLLLR